MTTTTTEGPIRLARAARADLYFHTDRAALVVAGEANAARAAAIAALVDALAGEPWLRRVIVDLTWPSRPIRSPLRLSLKWRSWPRAASSSSTRAPPAACSTP